MTDDILEQLNDSQREAVTYCDGASLVIAGAGSGKTRVLTYKIAYLLRQGLMPWNILALTFTNKAAREMKERIGALVGMEQARRLNMGTFHSVFSRILRAEAETIGYNSNFTIYDQSDSRSLVKAIIKEMGLDEKTYKHTAVADRISMAKNRLLLPQAYASSRQTVSDDALRKMPAIKDIYMRYSGRCRQSNAMDFDDLLVNTFVLLDSNEEVRRKYAERFAYVLVDEYQDTNYAQQAIVTLLTRDHQHICAVGDDAQSIYSFRGANIDNILNFTSSYDGARLFKLEQNYRSTQMIVQAANSLIKHNARQIPKDTFSRNEQGEKLVLKPAYSDKEEALIVCNDIKRIRRAERCEYSDFAVLYRTNSQSRSFEECMRKMNIPYRIYGGMSFYQRKEIKDVIAYFRVVVNPDDEEALRRVINYPSRGIGDTTVGRITAAATRQGVSLWTVTGSPAACGLDVNKGTLTKLDKFRQMVMAWHERSAAGEDAYTLGHAIIAESGVSRDIYSGRDPEDIARQENLEEFLSGMQDFVESRREEGMEDHVSLSDFLQEVSLLTDLESDADVDTPKVSLMTIHSAKGLEFPTVFVVGLEENIFPSPMCVNSMRELEEERRLLYVAVTRAEKHCILTCAQNRFRYGRMEYDTPSRFLKDFDPRLIRMESGVQDAVYPSKSTYRSASKPDYFSSRPPFYDEPAGRLSSVNPRPVAAQFRADPKTTVTGTRAELHSHALFTSQTAVSAATQHDVCAMPAPSPSDDSGICAGNVIEHQRFGIGEVLKIEGSGENTKATVCFRNAGTKQLLLKFAKYTVIS